MTSFGVAAMADDTPEDIDPGYTIEHRTSNLGGSGTRQDTAHAHNDNGAKDAKANGQAQGYAGNEETAHSQEKWRSCLRLTKNGVPYRSVANIATELENDPAWQGIFHFDEFQQQLMLDKPIPLRVGAGSAEGLPRPWRDSDSTTALRWFEFGDYPTIGIDKIELAIHGVAETKYNVHPVRNYLDRLRWDGKPRLDNWLETYCKAPIKDKAYGRYIRETGVKFLISAIARIYLPGVQADHVLVMEGDQGCGKTSALRMLGGHWFSESLPGDLHSKDASDHTRGKWIIELAELGQIRRTNTETLKAFISRAQERFRPAYRRNEIIYPRQCVFCGTTNKETYLPDETGNRRFWPVKVGHIDLDRLRRDRDELWAEAKARYESGENWWLEDRAVLATPMEEQAERYESDAWEDPIREYLSDKEEVTLGEVLSNGAGLSRNQHGKAEQNRAKDILTNSGWERGKRTGSRRPWVRREAKITHDAQ
jgi:putative DNA primase/helicase